MTSWSELRGRIFLVTGRRSFHASGANRQFDLSTCVHFTGFGSNPTSADVDRGCEAFEAGDFDLVVAVGGGSVIDLAKMIVRRRRPLVAVPTTAGTGSEVTNFAAVYVDGVKHSVEGVRPDRYILEPALLRSAPRYVAICAGLDALCQSIESLWSRQATEESKSYAARSVTLAREHLVPAVEGCAESQAKMLLAAHWSGRAIDISKTTASHALSYALTTRFGIPHGHAVALTIDTLRAYNDCPAVERLMSRASISAIMRRLGVAGSLRELGKSDAEIDPIADLVDPQRLANNPIPLTRFDLVAILRSHRGIR